MKLSNLKLGFAGFLISALSLANLFAQGIIDDIHNPRYGLPAYSKDELRTQLSKLPPQVQKAVQNSVPKGTLEQLKFVEDVLHGSQVFLAQLIKVREGDDSDGEVGDNFVYLLIEMNKGKAKAWKLYETNWPVAPPVVPEFGFVENKALKDCHLDFYVNQDRDNQGAYLDYFQFMPGKKPMVVLSCIECEYNPKENPNPSTIKQFYSKTHSTLIPDGNSRLKVNTHKEEGFRSLNPDPVRAAAESTKTVTDKNYNYQWDGSKNKYVPQGSPVIKK